MTCWTQHDETRARYRRYELAGVMLYGLIVFSGRTAPVATLDGAIITSNRRGSQAMTIKLSVSVLAHLQ